MKKKAQMLGFAALLSVLSIAGCGPSVSVGGGNSAGNTATTGTTGTNQVKELSVALSNSSLVERVHLSGIIGACKWRRTFRIRLTSTSRRAS